MCTYENKVFYAFKTKCLFEDDRIFIENMYDCVRMNKGTEKSSYHWFIIILVFLILEKTKVKILYKVQELDFFLWFLELLF